MLRLFAVLFLAARLASASGVTFPPAENSGAEISASLRFCSARRFAASRSSLVWSASEVTPDSGFLRSSDTFPKNAAKWQKSSCV